MKERNQFNIPVTRSSMPPFKEYVEEISSLWDSRWLTNCGAKHQQLQKELQKYLQVKHVELFTNGHSAIEAALEAFDIHGEVITTPFTFVSTTNAIVRKGATPIFVDIEPEWLTIDPSKIEDAITEKTEAILPVHVYGNLCDVDAIEKIANKHGLKVIYDAAHAFGVKRRSRGVMSFGDASAVSFHATKVFNTIEGGAVCTSSKELATQMAINRNFGLEDSVNCVFPGGNAKMNEFCAAMGLCNLKHIDMEIDKRKKLYIEYCNNLTNIPGLKVLKEQPGVKGNYAYMPILFDSSSSGISRDDIYLALKQKGINARKYFYPAINQMDWYRKFSNQNTPIANKAASQVLALPLYSDLTIEEVSFVCRTIKQTISRLA